MDVSLHRFAGVTAVLVLAACSGGGRSDSARTADTGVAVSSTPAPSESAATPAAAPAPSQSMADTSKRAPAGSAGTTGNGSTSDSAKRDSAKSGATAQRAHHTRAAPPAAKPSRRDTARAVRPGEAAAPAATATAGAAADTDTSTAAKQPSAQAPAPAPSSADAVGELHDKYHPAPLDTLATDAYQGWKQFELNCSRCHGEYAVGSSFAPALVVSLKEGGTIPTKEAFIATVCAGRPAKGMPSWCALGLGMDKINEIYAYVKGRADGKIHAGRPALRE